MKDIRAEFEGAALGDSRRAARLLKVADAVATSPDASFPNLAGSEAELEGVYRFMGNRANKFESIIAPHQARTAERAKAAGSVVAIHDTTMFQFVRTGSNPLGFTSTGKPGFYAHMTLVVTSDDERRPLGVINTELLFRDRKSRGRSKKTAQDPSREYARWRAGIDKTQNALADVDAVIHVADAEGGSYGLLAPMRRDGVRFVIRVRHDRRVRDAEAMAAKLTDASWGDLRSVVGKKKVLLTREVPLSARAATTIPGRSKKFPARTTRTAKLTITAATVVLRAPERAGLGMPRETELNVVRVFEPKPPDGQQPVEWLLATSEPVSTPEQVAVVVDHYRARWGIEEYFKALKTGCIYEQRQLESRHALKNALAIFIPIACQMLWLRARSRVPSASANDVVSREQLSVLRALAARPIPDVPSARDVVWAIAGIGGHLKHNGEPGWLTIRRGLDELMLGVTAIAAIRALKK